MTLFTHTLQKTHLSMPFGWFSRSQQIADFPLSGRKVPEYEMEQIREVIEGSYRIIYHIKSDQVDVLAVIHGSQDILHKDRKKA